MEQVYTGLMGPITPAAKGGYLVAKFTDDYITIKQIFLPKSKAEAVDSLDLYNNKTAAVSLGLRTQRLQTEKGGEYTQRFQNLCVDSGISVEHAATATPRQIRISERDGRTIATISGKCFLKGGNFSPNLWGEMFSTAVFISNRSPHSALGGVSLYFKMYNKEADMAILRAIGARASVHIEKHTPKLGDEAWERKLCGFRHNSGAYRIYNPPKGNCRRESKRHLPGNCTVRSSPTKYGDRPQGNGLRGNKTLTSTALYRRHILP